MTPETTPHILNPQPQSGIDGTNRVYKMTSNPRGIAMIINNERFDHLQDRTGTNVDATALKNLFDWLGFQQDPNPLKDLTAEDMRQKLKVCMDVCYYIIAFYNDKCVPCYVTIIALLCLFQAVCLFTCTCSCIKAVCLPVLSNFRCICLHLSICLS